MIDVTVCYKPVDVVCWTLVAENFLMARFQSKQKARPFCQTGYFIIIYDQRFVVNMFLTASRQGGLLNLIIFLVALCHLHDWISYFYYNTNNQWRHMFLLPENSPFNSCEFKCVALSDPESCRVILKAVVKCYTIFFQAKISLTM